MLLNPRYFFSFAKRLAKTKSSVGPLADKSGNLHTDAATKAELLQTQYSKVFSDPTAANVEESTAHLNPSFSIPLEDIDMSPADFEDAISQLDPYSATTDDCIPSRILLSCRSNLSIPLYLLWNKSFELSVIPPSLKRQLITPTYKNGDRTDPSNYRPISITSHIIKIF